MPQTPLAARSRRLGRKALRRLGYRSRPLAEGVWLLRQEKSTHRALPVMRRGEAWLVWNRHQVRQDVGSFQRRLGALALSEQVMWVLEKGRVDCVLDVGANAGQFAAGIRRAGYGGRIVSFEPVSAFFEQLGEAAAGDPDWWVRSEALGSRDGRDVIHAMDNRLSSLLPVSQFGAEFAPKDTVTTEQEITVRRLDGLLPSLLEGLEGRVFLKMDTQGYDLEVFRGAQGVLDSLVGLQSELACVPLYEGMTRLPEHWKEYEAAGFESAGMFPVSFDRRSARVIEYDAVMVRPDRMRS